MKLVIRKDIPIKYETGAYIHMPSYPASIDILFDLMSKVNDSVLKNKNITDKDLTIDLNDLKTIYKYEISENFKSKIIQFISDYKQKGYVIINDNKLVIDKTAIDLFYNTL